MYIFFLERYPHDIFAAGGALVPAQEKKRNTAFSPMGGGGLSAHIRKKRKKKLRSYHPSK